MAVETFTLPVESIEDSPGLTLSEARTNYIVSSMSKLAVVSDALLQHADGNRITSRLDMLPDLGSLERQYKGAIAHNLLHQREADVLPDFSPEDALRNEDKLRTAELATFAGMIGVNFGIRPRYHLWRASRGVRPVNLGWRSPSITFADAVEMRTIVRLHSERQALAQVYDS